MACLQIPAGHLAERIDAKVILCCGTALAALGYALAGLSGGIVGLSLALVLAGAGSSTQHPLASEAVSRAYGRNARRPLGIYNFTGDLGKAVIPAAMSLLLVVVAWQQAVFALAAAGIDPAATGPQGALNEAQNLQAAGNEAGCMKAVAKARSLAGLK